MTSSHRILSASLLAIAAVFAGAQTFVVGPQRQQDVGRGNAATNETTCAGDYTFGNNVIAGWNDYNSGGVRNGYASSTDGGTTWVSTVLRPPAQNQTSTEGDPFAIYDPRSGALWAGGMAFASNGGIFVQKHVPGTNTFEPPVMVFVGSTDKTWGAAGKDINNGNNTILHVSHQRGNSRSFDLGQTWQAPVSLGSGIGFLPRVGPNGELYIAYWDFSNGVMLKRSLDNGNTFTTIRIATRLDVWGTQDGSRFPGNFRCPSINYLAVDPISGVLYAVYSDTTNVVSNGRNVDLYFCKSTDRGSTWSTPRVINFDAQTPGDQFFPWIEVDRTGRIGIHFHDSRNVVQNDNSLPGWFDSYYMASDDGGTTWREARLTPQSWRSDLDGFGSGFIGDYSGMSVSSGRMVPSYITTQAGFPDIYGNVIINPNIVPYAFSTVRGVLIGGDADGTAQSDDRRLVTEQRPQVSPALANVETEFDYQSGSSTASRIDGRFELRCSGIPSSAIVQRIDLFDFATNQWVNVASGNPSSTDQVVTFAVTTGAQNFVRSDRRVRARVQYFDRGSATAGWTAGVDHALLTVTP
jgi:hypothetical protein